MNDFSVILRDLTFKERLNIIYKCLFKKEMYLKLSHDFNKTDMLPDYVKQNFCNSCEDKKFAEKHAIKIKIAKKTKTKNKVKRK